MDSKTSAPVVPKTVRWHERIFAYFIYFVLKLFISTIRFRIDPKHDYTNFFTSNEKNAPVQPVIFSIWHNRIALCLALFFKFAVKPQPSRKMAVMSSASRDGGIISKIIELHKVVPIRGSSSRRGGQALLEMRTKASEGYDLAITPDGPRGPRYKVHMGIIKLSQVTGNPIMPVCYHLSRKIVLKSWDGFQIPYPFCTATVSLGKPFIVPSHLSDEELEKYREKLNDVMCSITVD